MTIVKTTRRLPIAPGYQLAVIQELRDADGHADAFLTGEDSMGVILVGAGPTEEAAVEAATTLFQHGLNAIDAWQLDQDGVTPADQRRANQALAIFGRLQEARTEGFWSGVMTATGVMVVLVVVTAALAVWR